MAKSGDWGGNPAAIPGTVKRTANVTKNTTSTVSEPSFQSSEEAPKLKYYPEPNYRKEPFDPDLARRSAKGTKNVRGSR